MGVFNSKCQCCKKRTARIGATVESFIHLFYSDCSYFDISDICNEADVESYGTICDDCFFSQVASVMYEHFGDNDCNCDCDCDDDDDDYDCDDEDADCDCDCDCDDDDDDYDCEDEDDDCNCDCDCDDDDDDCNYDVSYEDNDCD